MDSPSGRDDGRFEEVLGRLDALVRRGQPVSEPPPPPQISEASIPVLTEIYEPTDITQDPVPSLSSGAPNQADELSVEENVERILALVLPVTVKAIENTIREEIQPLLNEAIERLLEELEPKAEGMLRQQLLLKLAQDRELD